MPRLSRTEGAISLSWYNCITGQCHPLVANPVRLRCGYPDSIFHLDVGERRRNIGDGDDATGDVPE
jgi:hypothetical protein